MFLICITLKTISTYTSPRFPSSAELQQAVILLRLLSSFIVRSHALISSTFPFFSLLILRIESFATNDVQRAGRNADPDGDNGDVPRYQTLPALHCMTPNKLGVKINRDEPKVASQKEADQENDHWNRKD